MVAVAAGLLVAGAQAFVTHTFALGPAVALPDTGAGSPYPTPIQVNGIDGVIDSMSVTVFITHTNPDDIDLLLVGPNGQKVLLMSDAGGSTDLTSKEIRFKDGAPALPDATAITQTEAAPTNYGSGDTFPSPAPTGTPASALSVFTGTSPNGTWKLFAVDDSVTNSGSFSWRMNITTRVEVPGGGVSIPDSGAGSPYPSTISIPTFAGRISRLEARLKGVTHTNPNDIDVLLVSPAGKKVRLMSDAGGSNNIGSVTLHFLDSAPTKLPNSGQIVSGDWKPSNYGLGDDNFPAPAPAGPYSDGMAAFKGDRAVGTWKLFVADDSSNHSGSISSWSLTIVTDDIAPQSAAIPDATVKEGKTLDVNTSATDPDGDPLKFTVTPRPFVTLTDNGNGTAKLHLAPQAGDTGSYTIDVAASDGDLSSIAPFHFTVTDGTPPTTTATPAPAPNAAGWNNQNVNVQLAATDLSSTVKSITFSATGAQPIPTTTVNGNAATVPAITTEGTTTLAYHATDVPGNAEANKTLVIKLDKTPPVLTSPIKLRAAAQPLGPADELPVRLDNWLGADPNGVSPSGLDRYSLRRRVNGGAFDGVNLPTPLTTSLIGLAPPGGTVLFRVRAVDVAGNQSDPSDTPLEAVELHQESDPGLVDTGTWTTQSAAFASGGATQFATAGGSTATMSFTGTDVSWVSSTGPDRGIAEVRVDGVLRATVDLFGSAVNGRQVVFTRTGMGDAAHSIEIRALGTKNASSTGTRVDVDAIGVLNPG